MTSGLDVDHARLRGTEPSTVMRSGLDSSAQAIALRVLPSRLVRPLDGAALRAVGEATARDGVGVDVGATERAAVEDGEAVRGVAAGSQAVSASRRPAASTRVRDMTQ